VHALEPNIQVLIAPIATQVVHEVLTLTQTSANLLTLPQLAGGARRSQLLLVSERVRTHAALICMLRNKTVQLSGGSYISRQV